MSADWGPCRRHVGIACGVRCVWTGDVAVERRWEKAVADGLPLDVSHAFGIFDRTLCGIQQAGMSPSDYGWLPQRGNVCGACREAAGVIDDRWPQAMRGRDERVSVARRL